MIARLKNPSWRQSVAKILCFVRGVIKKPANIPFAGFLTKQKLLTCNRQGNVFLFAQNQVHASRQNQFARFNRLASF